MSEEILRALMQLFAIVTKQDEGASSVMRGYVRDFLAQQITAGEVANYYALYEEGLGTAPKENEGAKRTSVLDSVKTLALCKKINRTLDQPQKVVVVVRLLQLVRMDQATSAQRMALVHTVGEVFNIDKEEFTALRDFVLAPDVARSSGAGLLHIGQFGDQAPLPPKHIHIAQFDSSLALLRVPSVDLYFVRYDGTSEVVLNGVVLPPQHIVLFPKGSTLKVPYGRPVYYSDVVAQYAEHGKVDRLLFRAEDLGYHFPTGNVGLRNISFQEHSGKLVGIMGASGSGKTTLLNVLSGIEAPTEGKVTINGLRLHESGNGLEGLVGYIPQDDLLIEELTVFENLLFSARLCLTEKSEEEIRASVSRVLEDLGIAQIAGLQVGSPMNKRISGGQRKRLNIGIELLREPAVLFVDEPTSGLSSLDSENVIELLRELALKGKLIFVVIHQPSSDIYKMFDKMLFLDVGGYLVYNGNPVEAIDHFKQCDHQVKGNNGNCVHCGTVSPEVVFSIIEAKVVDEFGRFTDRRKRTPAEWKALYDEQPKEPLQQEASEELAKALQVPSKGKQTRVYMLRDLLSKLRNTQYLLINALQAPLLAFILAVLIRSNAGSDTVAYTFRENQSIPAYLFMCVIVALFMGLTISAEEIFKDRKILKREALLHLSRMSYLVSKVVLLFGISAIQSLLFVAIGSAILDIEGMFLDHWLVLFSVQCCANVLGLLLSASLDSAVAIYILIPLFIIPQMVLGGAMFSFEQLNRAIGGGHRIPAMAQAIPSRWAYEALAVSQFKNNAHELPFFAIRCMESELSYELEFYLPELQRTVRECDQLLGKKDAADQAQLNGHLALLRNELEALGRAQGNGPLAQIEALVPGTYNTELGAAVITYLRTHEAREQALYKRVNEKKEAMIAEQQATPQLKAQYDATYDRAFNRSLSDALRKLQEQHKIVRQKGRLVQVVDPIYRLPETSALGLSAHFYAPYKYLLGQRWQTLHYNVLVLWVFTLGLFVMLYFGVVRATMSLVGRTLETMRSKATRKPEKALQASADPTLAN
jgi:ABC transport system ATP-binding/permease protein